MVAADKLQNAVEIFSAGTVCQERPVFSGVFILVVKGMKTLKCMNNFDISKTKETHVRKTYGKLFSFNMETHNVVYVKKLPNM